ALSHMPSGWGYAKRPSAPTHTIDAERGSSFNLIGSASMKGGDRRARLSNPRAGADARDSMESEVRSQAMKTIQRAFVSYSSVDAEVAKAVADACEKAGAAVFLDQRSLQPRARGTTCLRRN